MRTKGPRGPTAHWQCCLGLFLANFINCWLGFFQTQKILMNDPLHPLKIVKIYRHSHNVGRPFLFLRFVQKINVKLEFVLY